jgi:hypothetical protein
LIETMTSATARISSEACASPAYSRQDRAQYLTLLAMSSAALVIARILPPSPRGVGTHEQLGLPPCLFLKLTGLPCPSCGLTTSFAHAARLHFYDALVTQPFGLLAFGLTLLLIPLLCYLMRARVPWSRIIHARSAQAVTYTLLALYLIGWVYKIVVMR